MARWWSTYLLSRLPAAALMRSRRREPFFPRLDHGRRPPSGSSSGSSRSPAASVGLATLPGDGLTVEDLHRAADGTSPWPRAPAERVGAVA